MIKPTFDERSDVRAATPHPARADGAVRAAERSVAGPGRQGPDSAPQIASRRAALRALNAGDVPYVVAGAYAMREYTGIARDTKDLDVFCRRADVEGALGGLSRAGFRVERTDELWLAKGYAEDGEYVDIIFSSGNGVAEVDDLWLARARPAEVLGVPTRLAPPEEMIWSKSYVMERERYDGADVQHLVRACADLLDWPLLLSRMRDHAEVLLAHLLLFRFSYPGEREKVPAWVLEELVALSRRPPRPSERALCRGTLLSAKQYQVDLEGGLADCRPLEVCSWRAFRTAR